MSAISILIIVLLAISAANAAPSNHHEFLVEYDDSDEMIPPPPILTETLAGPFSANDSSNSSPNDLSTPNPETPPANDQDGKYMVTLGEAMAIMDSLARAQMDDISDAESEPMTLDDQMLTNGAESESTKNAHTETTSENPTAEVNAPILNIEHLPSPQSVVQAGEITTTTLNDMEETTGSSPVIMPPLVYPTLFNQVGHIYDAFMAKSHETTAALPDDVTEHSLTGTPSLISSTPCASGEHAKSVVVATPLPVPSPPTEPTLVAVADSDPVNAISEGVTVKAPFLNFEHLMLPQLTNPLKDEPEYSINSNLAANYHDALMDESESGGEHEHGHGKCRHNRVAPLYQSMYVFVVKIPIIAHTLKEGGGIDGSVAGYVPIVVSVPGLNMTAKGMVDHVAEM